MQTPFDKLEVAENADDGQIKSAYLKKIREYPPEHHPEKFKDIKSAYDKIKTVRDRVSYRLFNIETPTIEDLTTALKPRDSSRIKADKLLQLISEAAKEQLTKRNNN